MRKVKFDHHTLTQYLLTIIQQNMLLPNTHLLYFFLTDILNHFPVLNKTTNLYYQEKTKRSNTNFKIKSKRRYDKTNNFKISDATLGHTILVKQQKQNKFKI